MNNNKDCRVGQLTNPTHTKPMPFAMSCPCPSLRLLPTYQANQCQGEAGKRGCSSRRLRRPQLRGETRLPQVVSNVTKRSYNEFFCCRNVSAWDLAKADFENGVISLPVADTAWSGVVSYIPSPRKYCLLEQGRMIQNCI